MFVDDDSKRTLLLFADSWELAKKLSREQQGVLLQAIFSTSGICERPEFDELATEIVYTKMECDILRNREKWESVKQKRAAAGRKGGMARRKTSENKEEQSQTEQSKAKQSKAEPKEKGPSKSEIDGHFNNLWALYPRKEGKTAVKETTRKKLLKVSEKDMQTAIERYKVVVNSETYERSYMMGSTWFNGRYEDYIGDEYEPPAEPYNKRPSSRYRSKKPPRDFSWKEREDNPGLYGTEADWDRKFREE